MLAREIILLVILLTCLISQFLKWVLTSVCEFLEPHGYEWQTLNDDYLFAKPALTWVRFHTFHHLHFWNSWLWHLNIIMPWYRVSSPSTMGPGMQVPPVQFCGRVLPYSGCFLLCGGSLFSIPPCSETHKERMILTEKCGKNKWGFFWLISFLASFWDQPSGREHGFSSASPH